ncbi:hypothetical protein FACS1894195_2130 [Bacteroidia bacterium]|nr:hypothetical protein FACS1894195_2130 [Bacteroidia bacterium]
MIKEAKLVINTACNNACSWCYAQTYQGVKAEMSVEVFDKTLSLLKSAECSNFTFMGGEPTLHKQLPLFVSKAASHGIHSLIVSNGSNFTDTFLAAFENVKESLTLNVSIEGATSITHDKVTQTLGSFDKLQQSVLTATKRKFKIGAIMTLCKENRCDLPNVMALLEKWGVKNLLVNYATYPLNTKYTEANYLTLQEFSESVAKTIGTDGQRALKIKIGPPLPHCMLLPHLHDLMEDNQVHFNNECAVLSGNSIAIDFNGNILTCSHLTDVKFGNIGDFSNAEKFKTFLSSIVDDFRVPLKKYPLKKCNDCSSNEVCFGGCPMLWLQ